MQHRVAGAIGSSARPWHRLFAKMRRMPAERALINRAVRIAIERHPKVLELIDNVRRLSTHELDRILVAKIIGPLDRVEHVPKPVVLGHVAERCADSALCSNRMRASGKDL